MRKNKALFFIAKQFFLLALCVCLITGFCLQPVRSTVSYITFLSATCVNTFSGEETTEVPKPSDSLPTATEDSETTSSENSETIATEGSETTSSENSETTATEGSETISTEKSETTATEKSETDTPRTGDDSHPEWYFAVMLISLAVLLFTLTPQCKRWSNRKKQQ